MISERGRGNAHIVRQVFGPLEGGDGEGRKGAGRRSEGQSTFEALADGQKRRGRRTHFKDDVCVSIVSMVSDFGHFFEDLKGERLKWSEEKGV